MIMQLAAKITPFPAGKHPNLRREIIVFSLVYQRIEPIGLLMSPAKPLISLAS